MWIINDATADWEDWKTSEEVKRFVYDAGYQIQGPVCGSRYSTTAPKEVSFELRPEGENEWGHELR